MNVIQVTRTRIEKFVLRKNANKKKRKMSDLTLNESDCQQWLIVRALCLFVYKSHLCESHCRSHEINHDPNCMLYVFHMEVDGNVTRSIFSRTVITTACQFGLLYLTIIRLADTVLSSLIKKGYIIKQSEATILPFN